MSPAPDMPRLILAAGAIAAAIGVPAPEAAELDRFLRGLLYEGRAFWVCYTERLITQTELRDVTMAHLATWLCGRAGVTEPGSDRWSSRALELDVERALFS